MHPTCIASIIRPGLRVVARSISCFWVASKLAVDGPKQTAGQHGNADQLLHHLAVCFPAARQQPDPLVKVSLQAPHAYQLHITNVRDAK